MSARTLAAGSTAGDELSPAVLQWRIALIAWVILVGNLLFAATDLWLFPHELTRLAAVKAAVIAVQVAGLVWLRREVTGRAAIRAGLVCMAVGVAGGVVSGVMVGDPFTTPILCTAAALFTGSVVPWGVPAQAVAASLALAGGALTVGLTVGLPAAAEPIVGLVVVAGLSVYTAGELARQRAAEARARLALQRHQAELAHVLRVSAMGEMSGQLAHELTQPLGAIANYAAGCRLRLQASPQRPEAVIEAVDRIGREAMRAGAIIRRMRDFLRKTEPAREPVDVGALVREVAALLDVEARVAGVRIELLLEEHLPPVEANAVEIEQVLVNLARNAIEAMQDGAGRREILIETRHRPPRAVEVFVRDTGPGLPRDAAAEVFEPFFTTKRTGLGLGLAISRTIIEMHGGTLSATSTPSGATFRFTLPVAGGAAAVATG
ncbi:MAG: ATP-binding protein [Candidatus Binatia bacterium]